MRRERPRFNLLDGYSPEVVERIAAATDEIEKVRESAVSERASVEPADGRGDDAAPQV